MKNYIYFQKKYPKFIYKNYSYRISEKDLEIFFDFEIEPNIFFRPEIIIKNINKTQLTKVGKSKLNDLIFHLGLIELPSYWKATCSPKIEIQAGYLNKKQILWWRNLIINGMGQFFYENGIDFTRPNFFKISSGQKKPNFLRLNVTREDFIPNRVLVPIGGGKDSIVSLEILKKGMGINCLTLNPTQAAKKIMKIAGYQKPIIVKRKIDKKLLNLNRKGFLNGHTPFSTYLAFLSILIATIFNYKYIAFSNERSANEGNLKYLGKNINHQYSKSFDFEGKFRNYYKKYLIKAIEYFSFLRPFYEIQISRLFSLHPKYFPAFLSCNKGQKKGFWCGKCPKCLFVFTSLYPFIDEKKLIKIFKKNLFKDRKLLPAMLGLMGQKDFKPFECVGTKKENLIVFYLSWKKAKEGKKSLPFLLKYFEKNILEKYKNLGKESKRILNSWNNQHNLTKEFEKILKQKVRSFFE